jgi:hypothetical protein
VAGLVGPDAQPVPADRQLQLVAVAGDQVADLDPGAGDQ